MKLLLSSYIAGLQLRIIKNLRMHMPV